MSKGNVEVNVKTKVKKISNKPNQLILRGDNIPYP